MTRKTPVPALPEARTQRSRRKFLKAAPAPPPPARRSDSR